MTWLFVTLGLAISTSAFFYLAHVNAKRRRSFKLAKYDKTPRIRSAVFVLLLPGLLFLGTSGWSALVVWMAGITVIGWVIAATSPIWLSEATARLRHRALAFASGSWRFIRQTGALIMALAALPEALRTATARIELLEAKIGELETELITLKAKLPKPRSPRKRPVKRTNGNTEPEAPLTDTSAVS